MRPILVYDLLRAIATGAEDCWIEREFFRSKLLEAGFTESDLQKLATEAKTDATWRSQAHEALAQMWKVLDDAAQWFVIQDLGEEPPPNDKLS